MFTEASSVFKPVWRSRCTDATVRACDVISWHRDVTFRDSVAPGQMGAGTEKRLMAKGLSSTTVTEPSHVNSGLDQPL